MSRFVAIPHPTRLHTKSKRLCTAARPCRLCVGSFGVSKAGLDRGRLDYAICANAGGLQGRIAWVESRPRLIPHFRPWQLPDVGDKMEVGKTMSAVESVKAAADVSPRRLVALPPATQCMLCGMMMTALPLLGKLACLACLLTLVCLRRDPLPPGLLARLRRGHRGQREAQRSSRHHQRGCYGRGLDRQGLSRTRVCPQCLAPDARDACTPGTSMPQRDSSSRRTRVSVPAIGHAWARPLDLSSTERRVSRLSLAQWRGVWRG